MAEASAAISGSGKGGSKPHENWACSSSRLQCMRAARRVGASDARHHVPRPELRVPRRPQVLPCLMRAPLSVLLPVASFTTAFMLIVSAQHEFHDAARNWGRK